MKIIKKCFPFLIIFLIWVVFFNKFIFKGLIPIPSDITTGMYYPWINHNYGYPVHVPVKNPILTDTVSQFWIWRNWAIDNLKNGKISIWNPYALAGYPMSPWFHTILFSPANLFYFLFNQATSMGLIVSSQLLILLISTYLFLLKITKLKTVSIFGSVSLSFSAFSLGWLTWGTVGWTISFLPLVLLSIINTNYFGLFFCLLFSLLGGHPQTFLYTFIIIFLFIIFNSSKKKTIFIAIIFSLLASAFVTLPSVKILSQSIRGNENYLSSSNFGFIPPQELLISLISPNFFGNPATNNYWGQGPNFQEKLSWFGTIPFIFSLYYLIKILTKDKKNKIDLFLISTFFIGIMFSLKYPFGFLIYKFKIPLLSTAPASRALFLTAFSGSLLSALTLKDLVKNQLDKKSSKWMITIISLYSLSLLIILGFLYINHHPNLITAFRNTIIPFFALLISLLTFILNRKIVRFILIPIIFVVTLFEGFRFGWKYTPFTDKSLYFPKTPSIEFIQNEYQKTNDFFRIERQKAEIMPPNMWQSYKFYTLSGYDPVFPLSYSKFLDEQNIIKNSTRYVEWKNQNIDKICNYGVKFLLVIKRDIDDKPSAGGSLPNWVNRKKWQNVFEEGAVTILKNKDYQPPYYTLSPSQITLLRHDDDYWEFKVENGNDTQFFLLENNDSNWIAMVNGKATTIDTYQSTFKSINLPAGKNEVVFKYNNKLLKIGFIISFFSFFLFLGVMKYVKKKYKK